MLRHMPENRPEPSAAGFQVPNGCTETPESPDALGSLSEIFLDIRHLWCTV